MPSPHAGVASLLGRHVAGTALRILRHLRTGLDTDGSGHVTNEAGQPGVAAARTRTAGWWLVGWFFDDWVLTFESHG